ncbi:protein SICKLE isoform X2 [Corylus avellana]|uniref:protein SICKLE isoform X2 n=1 Tax=Corylus avellana TaxID=13451 RepID=UPI00286C0E2C|nr:protein SICKLE isoform X2 [Corylus avellana]
MEESEKRRERLKAMRMQAAQAEVSNNVESSGVPGCLSNPLIETSAVQESCTPRFDFYTDPMAAFSDSRKRSNAVNQIRPDSLNSPSAGGSPTSRFSPSHPGPRNPVMSPSPAHQIQGSWQSNQTMYEAQGFSYSSGPYRSPIGMASPFSMHPRTPEAWNGPMGPTSFSSNPSRGVHLPSPGFGPRGGSQCVNTEQGRGRWVSHSPSPVSGQGLSPSPRPGRGGGHWYGSSMSPGSGQGLSPSPRPGRGGGRSYGSSMRPGLGWSSGRGQGSHTPQGAERFYNESMLEDPWKFLKPVLWRSVVAPVSRWNTSYSSKSWTGKSHSTKKARVSEASNKSSPQPSLAEYLAASFNEALNDAANT